MRFDPDQIATFRLTSLDVDVDAGAVALGYALDDDWVFTERIAFGPRRAAAGDDPATLDEGFRRVARLLHLAAGVSYYKAAAPGAIELETAPLTEAERALVLGLYDEGLREFAWRNGLPLDRPPTVPPATADPGRPGTAVAAPAGIGIPIGGGKDSAVVVEALRHVDPVLVSVGGHPAAHRVAAAAGLPLAVVERRLDPGLLALNAAGARNGHVPITAIVSLIAVAAGYRLGYDTTVMALEGSADEPTRTAADGTAVNHQWSKGSEHQALLVAALADAVGSGAGYRSVLRQADELAIARCFAGLPRYHRAFLSCNQAFSRSGVDRWCGRCPKCRFVFLALATALGPDELVPIFGADLLADPGQVEGFRDLFEEGRKPFECVGTRAESLAAVACLADDGPWTDRAVVRTLAGVARSASSRTEADGSSTGGGVPRWGQRDPEPLLAEIRAAVGVPPP
jgi:hypothetical protein